MDFHLTREQEMVRKMYREFAENEVKPLAEELDEEERFPMETVEKMGKLGMMGIYFPKKYGGAGGDVLSYAMCVEELSKVCGTTGVIVSAHTSLCCAPIYEHGTEEQKMKYLPDLLSGKKIGAFGLTEPNAGTDASGQQTLAVLEGDHYVLNGSKCFITNGNVADTFVVFAMTDKSKGNHGISAFIVEKDFPGFSTGKHEKKMGIRGSSTCDLIFEDCIVPKENLLGQEGKGFKIAMQTLDGGRIGIAAQALGIAEGAMEEAMAYTKGRVQFGKPISKFQNTQFTLAHMQADVVEHLFLGVPVAHAPVADFEHRLTERNIPGGIDVQNFAPDHAADDSIFGKFICLPVQRFDRASVTDDRDLVGDLLQLVELMRNDDARHALGFQLDQKVQKPLRVRLVQGGCRLIQDQKPDVFAQCLRNFHQLLLTGANIFYKCVNGARIADSFQQFACAFIGLAPVDHTVMFNFIA